MARAKRDQNDKPTALGASSVDNSTPIRLTVDTVTGSLLTILSGDVLTVIPANLDKHDQNDVPTVYGVSSADGITLLPIRTDTSGKLLVQIT